MFFFFIIVWKRDIELWIDLFYYIFIKADYIVDY